MSVVAQFYERFADVEAAGVSDVYEQWARGVAGDTEVCTLIETLPAPKRQPNLVFAAARWEGAPDDDYSRFRTFLVTHWDAVAATVLARATQTNEAARCATLLPALSRIDGPIALLEVGASGGLCLFPDRYGYRFRATSGDVALAPDAPLVLGCAIDGPMPDVRRPDVVWRAGLDLDPIDLCDPAELDWLDVLIWPGHEERRARLRTAATIVAADPPKIVRGDLVDDLPALAARAPRDATLVVFHSAVLAYVPAPRRVEFAAVVDRLGARWISNEGQSVLPDVTAQVPSDVDAVGSFVVALDGVALGLAGPHGQSYRSLGRA